MMQQCLTCSRRNIPPEQVSCPACGSVNLRGYDPEASDAPVFEYDPESDGGEGEDLDREDRARWARAAKLDREGDV